MKKNLIFLLPAILLPLWYLIYHYLQQFTDWLVYSVFNMIPGNPLTEALRFFIYEFPKVILLLTLIIFIIGIIRTFFTPERTRKALEGRKTFTGNVMAAGLGIVTPFCSCSAIPLFIGFVEAGVPLGVTFSFLIASPMINEVAIVLLYGMFGVKVAMIYVLTGLVIAITAGWIIGILKLERWIEPWIYSVQTGQNIPDEKNTWRERIKAGYYAVSDIVGRVWIFVALGIAVGAFAHGYVPDDFMASLMGKSVWYSVPLSVLIGIPLYANAAAIVPIVSVLLGKGAALGTALAFMMAVIGLSLPEMIILRKVLKMPLILTFIGVIATGIVFTGYFFNIIL